MLCPLTPDGARIEPKGHYILLSLFTNECMKIDTAFCAGPQEEEESEGGHPRGVMTWVRVRGGEDSPISISFVGGQPGHKDPQEGSQDPRHPVEVVDATRVLEFEFRLEVGLEDGTPIMSPVHHPPARLLETRGNRCWGTPCSARGPRSIYTVKNLYPSVETVPARKPAARAPKGVSIISPDVPTTTPPASAAFWM